MLELLIGLVVTIAVGYFIVKGYKAAGVLLTAGIALLLMTGVLGHDVLPSNPHGHAFLKNDGPVAKGHWFKILRQVFFVSQFVIHKTHQTQ